MPRLFISGIVLFLLLGAGYGLTQAARYTPWDCADWQAFAHADRPIAILESLAENRGKTLYCGIDQSDTFGKAETWAAGKDRNERDDTVYWGERGSFRGFIAAQEGWLTDGESGITGQSIAVIFEFPKEERRRTKRTKRISISSQSDRTVRESCHNATPPGDLLCSGEYASITTFSGSNAVAQRGSKRNARGGYYGDESVGSGSHDWRTSPDPFGTNWQELAETVAANACTDLGYRLGRVAIGPGHDNDKDYQGTSSQGDNLGWFYRNTLIDGNTRYAARQSRTWTATCKKITRRSRR